MDGRPKEKVNKHRLLQRKIMTARAFPHLYNAGTFDESAHLTEGIHIDSAKIIVVQNHPLGNLLCHIIEVFHSSLFYVFSL